MSSPNWDDDAAIERKWCGQQRSIVSEYLARQEAKFGELAFWPAWHVAPYVAIWAIESTKAPGKVGWWAISGDLPTDYASGSGVRDPRSAAAVFSQRWAEAARAMERGEELANFRVGRREDAAQLGPLLRARAEILADWVRDDSMWEEP